MRILITGASGFIGSHLGVRLTGHGHQVMGTVLANRRRLPFPHEPLDLTLEKPVAALLQEFKPQVIVHAAAMSKVVGCEENSAAAEEMNVEATARLVRWAVALHSRLIFLSTDQVFSGSKGAYRESADPAPLGVYGRTKLEAERAILTSPAKCLIVRSNSVLGPSLGWGESFSDWILHRLRAERVAELFEDQYRSPIHIRSMLDVLETACIHEEYSGLLHVGGPRRLSRADIGFAVARAYRLPADSIRVVSYKTHSHAHIMTPDTSYDISRLLQSMPFVKLKSLDDELIRDAEEEENNR